ncbi:MAG TPA: lipopolysaccharide kinase InaA family protein, partial [Candidatus Binataceae bacterium]|nr:lipopolysaccharide kinase InaA family protein [Candidatus Binataceae bacterium]
RCAKPLAAMNEIRGGAIVGSYLMSEVLDRAQILSIFALGYHSERLHEIARLRAISHALAREVHRLHESGLYTLDLQQTNIMVEDSDAGPIFYFLDLEDFRRSIRVSERRRFLNLVHLDRSIGRHVSRATRLDFLYKYAGLPASRSERRDLVRRYMRVRASVERRRQRRRITRAADKPIEA